MVILSPEEIRKAEDCANKAGLSYEEMMENAGMGCAEYILKSYPDSKNIVIICGKGKNGGDGFVIARGLWQAGKCVSVIHAFSSPSDELSEKNRMCIEGCADIFDGSKITKSIISLINKADIIVDAVFGIGFKGKLPENVKELFGIVNKTSAVKIAIDIPSGLSVKSESVADCFTADETLSMLCYKAEHIYKPFSDICGKTTVIPIGFECSEGMLQTKTPEEIKALLPHRPYNSNKGTFGKALIIAGSRNMPGASVIATKAALNSGVGLTFLAFPDNIYNTVTAHLTECVFRPLPSGENGGFSPEGIKKIIEELPSFDAIAMGPGVGTDKGAEILICEIIKNYKGKLIIDADGINIISRNINIIQESEAQIALTPHPGEMARLTGLSIKEINSKREDIAREFTSAYGVTLLLKGANTVVASPCEALYINPTGSSALSRGGSGDLLTGLIVSFAAQGLSVTDAAILGAYVHGLAGETAEKKFTAYGASVENITECVPKALSKIISGK